MPLAAFAIVFFVAMVLVLPVTATDHGNQDGHNLFGYADLSELRSVSGMRLPELAIER